MLTVPEAARRTKRDPETVRRWIRSGRLKATKIGTQHLIDEEILRSRRARFVPVERAGRAPTA